MTVLIDLDSIQTDADRAVVREVENWATAMKCGITAFDSTDKRLVLGSGYTHGGRDDSHSVTYYAKQCERILKSSSLTYRIRPVAPYHFLPYHGDNPILDMDVDRLGDEEYRKQMQPAVAEWETKQQAYWERIKSYGAGNEYGTC